MARMAAEAAEREQQATGGGASDGENADAPSAALAAAPPAHVPRPPLSSREASLSAALIESRLANNVRVKTAADIEATIESQPYADVEGYDEDGSELHLTRRSKGPDAAGGGGGGRREPRKSGARKTGAELRKGRTESKAFGHGRPHVQTAAPKAAPFA